MNGDRRPDWLLPRRVDVVAVFACDGLPVPAHAEVTRLRNIAVAQADKLSRGAPPYARLTAVATAAVATYERGERDWVAAMAVAECAYRQLVVAAMVVAPPPDDRQTAERF